jgi:hypothetical protein
MPTYTLPNGGTTDDEQLYQRLWREVALVVETLVPGARVTEFGETMSFSVVGQEQPLVLPLWLIQTLVKTARPMNGRAFKLAAVRTQACESCGTPVHTSGAGRTRRFCSECMVVRVKLRTVKEVEP